MFPLKQFQWPDEQGQFGAIRKYDIHTGIDLYCDEGSEVFAIENGIVVSVETFTGPAADSPWWNETMAVLITSPSGVICYGEVEPLIKIGDKVMAGDVVGRVKRVLKEDKGRPTSMLHLELYKHGVRNTTWWRLGEERPKYLLDPGVLLNGK